MSEGVTVHVDLPYSPYDITVCDDILSEIAPLLAPHLAGHKAAIISDSNVGASHAKTVAFSFKSVGIEPIVATLSAGEEYKTLASLLPVFDQLLDAKIERSTPIIAVGGGVVGDMAGFVAAVILRGVPFVQVPTTLLSMVDASIGGKTGVDHALGKNLIGAFHQPIAVFIDPQTLATLPPQQFRSGLAECIKHDLIRDADGFVQLEKQLELILKLDPRTMIQFIAHNVAIKAKVVSADPFEKGERAHLNFGHTFGHAIETVSNFSYAHGEAIALGMTAAAYTSQKLGMIDAASTARIKALIDRAGLPTGGLKLDADRILEVMQSDKKVKSGRIRFVLLERIGQATVRDDVPPALVREAIDSLRG
ncbi:MAG: 3-dehydroquinate synthase [Planctomycetota bacterium]|nr:3-dehydroquinate synthase [Planctomycetota bacterium]